VHNTILDAVSLLLRVPTNVSGTRCTRISGVLILRGITFLDDGSEGVTHDEDGKLLHFLEAVAGGLRVVKLATDVCVAVLEEEGGGGRSTDLLREDLHVDAWQRLVRFLLCHLQLSVGLSQCHLDLSRIVCTEELLAFPSDFNHHIL
jgi:hypothetical protein